MSIAISGMRNPIGDYDVSREWPSLYPQLMLARPSHTFRSFRTSRVDGRRTLLRAAMMVLLALVIACSGGSDDRGPNDGPPRDGPGDQRFDQGSGDGDRSGDGQSDFERAPDGNIPPIAPPPTLGDPTATPATGTSPTGTSTTATPGSVVADERVYSCSIDGDHDTLEHIQSTLTPVTPANETLIAIDGDSSDWVGRPTVVVDPIGDAEASFPDFGAVRAFLNENALYLTAEVSESSAKFDSFEIDANDGTRNLFFGWSP